MQRWTKVESAFGEWLHAIDFLEQADRRFLAELLFSHLYDLTFLSKEELQASGFASRYPNWAALISSVLDNRNLRKATSNHEEFAISVAKDVLRWCMKMHYAFLAHHDFQSEDSQVKHLSQHLDTLPSEAFRQHAARLSTAYPGQEVLWRFYEQALLAENFPGGSVVGSEQAVLRENFLSDWKQALAGSRLEAERNFLDQSWASYLHDLSDKADRLDEIEEIIEPFSQFLGQAWNASLGNWHSINWAQLRATARRMKEDPQLQELVTWLGRWQSNREAREWKRRNRPLPQQHWQPNPFGKSEIVGIHHSNHLDQVLPSEIALLSSEETDLIFSLKFLEHKLLTFQYRSLDVRLEEDPQAQTLELSDNEAMGPFVLCIDTSGSMFGSPEHVAKGLALAITELALRSKRACYLISFATGVKAMELTGMEQQIESLVAFLNMSFHGSTDLHPALEEASRMLHAEHFKKADVLVISDFLIPRLDRALIQEIKHLKTTRGVRYHSLLISRNPDSAHVPLPVFDHHWVYDLDHPGVMRQWVEYMQLLEETSESSR